MAMQLVRTGTAGVVGAVSGAVSDRSFDLGGNQIGYDTAVEALALVAGAGLQFMSPFTAPNLADGLVDGGVALLGRRVAIYTMGQIQTSPMARRVPAPQYRHQVPAGGGSRAQIGGGTDVPKYAIH